MLIEMLTVSSCSNDKPSFRSTPWRPPNKAGLINRPPIRPYVRVSVHPSTKRFFNLNEIWYFGSDWWVIDDDMPYDPILDQVQGGPKVAKMSWFLVYGWPEICQAIASLLKILFEAPSKLAEGTIWGPKSISIRMICCNHGLMGDFMGAFYWSPCTLSNQIVTGATRSFKGARPLGTPVIRPVNSRCTVCSSIIRAYQSVLSPRHPILL